MAHVFRRRTNPAAAAYGTIGGQFSDETVYWDLVNGARQNYRAMAGEPIPQGPPVGAGAGFAGSAYVPGQLASAGFGGAGAGAAGGPPSKRMRRASRFGPGGDPSAAGALAPPAEGMLTNRDVDSLVTPAEASNAPYLLGKQGGPGTNPPKEFARVMTAAATSAEAVAPGTAGGTAQVPNAGPRAAVSTQHTPDHGVESAAMERARQLPSRMVYRQMEAALAR